jgi:hypothetical protein
MGEIPKGEFMPNWVRNKVTINGSKEDRKAIKELMKGEREFDFNKIIQMPLELLEIHVGGCTIKGKSVTKWKVVDGENVALSAKELNNLNSKYGTADWYDWACKNWGTKWNTSIDGILVEDRQRTLIYDFDTAWSSPTPIFIKLSELFPHVTIKVKVSGEIDYPYSSTFHNGEEE